MFLIDSYWPRALQQTCPYSTDRDDAPERDAIAETAAILTPTPVVLGHVRIKNNSGELLKGHSLHPVSL